MGAYEDKNVERPEWLEKCRFIKIISTVYKWRKDSNESKRVKVALMKLFGADVERHSTFFFRKGGEENAGKVAPKK